MRPEDFQTARLELEWKNFGYHMMVDAGLMLEPEFMIRQDGYDFLRDQITVAMRTKILTDNLPPEHVSHTTHAEQYLPTSTWQMWKYRNKERWYARRLVARWPVKWAVDPDRKIRVEAHIDLERFRAYPEAQYRPSDFRLGRAVLMHSVSPVEWWKDINPEQGE